MQNPQKLMHINQKNVLKPHFGLFLAQLIFFLKIGLRHFSALIGYLVAKIEKSYGGVAKTEKSYGRKYDDFCYGQTYGLMDRAGFIRPRLVIALVL